MSDKCSFCKENANGLFFYILHIMLEILKKQSVVVKGAEVVREWIMDMHAVPLMNPDRI